MIASVALGNTDDHLRNHGFLASRGSWTLSPAFDVNPNPDPMARRSTSIAGADTFPEETEGLLALAEDCDITRESARERIGAVVDHLAPWRECARSNRLSEHVHHHDGGGDRSAPGSAGESRPSPLSRVEPEARGRCGCAS